EPKGPDGLEALANGTPVVAPRHGSCPELVEAAGGGLLVEPDDPADLARGLRRLLDDAAEREKLGRQGKEAVFRHFHAERMARETADVYSRYLSLGPDARHVPHHPAGRVRRPRYGRHR